MSKILMRLQQCLERLDDGLFKVLEGQHVYTDLEEKIRWNDEPWTMIKLTF